MTRTVQTDFAVKLAYKIKTARRKAGLSQKELGDKLNLSDKAISTYEVGRAEPSLETLNRISEITQMPMVYFIEDLNSEEIKLKAKLISIEQELQAVKELLKKGAADSIKEV